MKRIGHDEIDFGTLPDKLNLGCGFDKRDGYVNIDLAEVHAPDVVGDVLCLDSLPRDHYAEILAQDILEHLPWTATRRALLHWASRLRSGGVLALRVPNVLGIAKLLAMPENGSLSRQEEIIKDLFGTQAYSGDFHCTTFTETSIRGYLQQCGFEIVRVEEKDGWLLDVTARKRASVSPREIGDFSDLLDARIPDERFVHACYQEILGREADAQGLAFYAAELRSGRIDRSQLISVLASSPERKQAEKSWSERIVDEPLNEAHGS